MTARDTLIKMKNNIQMQAIFDLGNVILDWNPNAFIRTLPFDTKTQDTLYDALFNQPNWQAMDAGEKTEAEVISHIARTTNLDEHQLITTMNAARDSLVDIPETIVLLHELKQRGVPLFCLSNISVENYAFVRHRAFFKLFDGIVISGMEKLVKPDQRIFELLHSRFNLTFELSVFIDDMPENITAAEQLGITGVLFDRSVDSYRQVRKRLI